MHKILETGKPPKGGRNRGRIAVPRRGALVRRNYRFINTKRSAAFGKIMVILKRNIYDPNRSGKLTLVTYLTGNLTYILEAAYALTQKIVYNLKMPKNNKEKGWSDYIGNIPLGTVIFNIETIPGMGAKLMRAAGTSAILLKKDDKINGRVVIKLKSGEHRLVSKNVIVSVGVVSNHQHFLRDYKKAGTIRLYGKRPRVRPSVMNPVDHPMGGRTKGGCAPKSKTGKLSHGPSTANKKEHKLIITTARKSRKQRIS